MKTIYSVVLACVLIVMPLAAQTTTEPTYQDTTNWIVTKLAHDAGRDYPTSKRTIEDPIIENCILHYVDREEVNVDGKHWVNTRDTRIPLASVALTNASGTTTVNLWSETNSFHTRFSSTLRSSNSHEENTHDVYINFGRPGVDAIDMASRMAKAIDHAANLCRAQTPKSNEPF